MSRRPVDAATVVESVAGRLAHPDYVIAHGPTVPPHIALPGCAILAGRLAETGATDAGVALTHLDAVMKALPAQPSNIFYGAAGSITSALIVQAMVDEPRLDPMVRSGTQWLSNQARRRARESIRRDSARGLQLAVSNYDAVSGLAGLGRVLLLAELSGHPSAEPGLLAALTALTELLTDRKDLLPGWWQPQEEASPFGVDAPDGCGFVGMAHGVAGPLSLLSVAMAAGRSVDGQRDAIAAVADWILAWRRPETGTWPVGITGDELRSKRRLAWSPPIVHKWCIGQAGIGQALHLAGLALNDPKLIAEGIDALASARNRPVDQWGITGTSLCCGYGGVLQAALTAAAMTPDHRLDEVADLAAAVRCPEGPGQRPN